MSAHSPSSYALSLTVHGTAVVVLLAIAWGFQHQAPKPVAIFELVAGEGDNYTATVAPALGTPGGADLKVPSVPIPPPMTLPKIEEPAPLPPVPVETPPPVPVAKPPEPVKAAPVKDATKKASEVPAILDQKPTTFTQDIKRLSDKRQKRLMDKFHKDQAAKAKKEAELAKKEAEAQKRMMTEEEFRKKYGVKSTSKSGAPTKVAKIDSKGIANGVVGGSTANDKGGAGGTALARQEASLMEAYYSLLLQRLQESHVPPPGVGDQLVTGVSCFIAVDGSISRIRVSRSSGNKDFDQSALDAFRKVVLPIRPDGRSGEVTMDFKAQER